MAQNYTDAEINAAVTKIVRESIRKSYGALGTRDLSTSFSDIRDAAAGLFILVPNSVYYVVYLGAQRLRDTVSSVSSSASSLQDVITSTNRRVKPVESLTALNNARTALGALVTATGQRVSNFLDIETTPAFRRFNDNVDRFLTKDGANVRSGGSIVRTPQQAKSELASVLLDVEVQYSEIKSKVQLLSAALEDFNSLSLSVSLSRSILQNAQSSMQASVALLENLSPTARLEKLRTVVLDTLASKAVVRGFGTPRQETTFITIEGTGSVFADSDHPATPAFDGVDLVEPYTLIDKSLTFTMDSDVTFSLDLPNSYVAALEGRIAEVFEIVASTNDTLTITVEGFPDVVVTLTAGANQTAQEVCDDINAAITTEPIVAEPFLNPVLYTGSITTQNASGGSLELVRPEGDWADVGAVPFESIIVITDPTSTMDGLRFSVVSLAGDTATCALLDTGTTANEAGIVVEMGPGARFVRIRVTNSDAEDAIDDRLQIGIAASSDDAAETLGFFVPQSIRCRGTRAEDIVTVLNQSTLSAPAGTPRLVVSAEFSTELEFSGRSDPLDAFKIIASTYRTTGNVTATGALVALEASGAASAGVEVGDKVTFRSATLGNNPGLQGTVTAVTDTSVSATMDLTASTESVVELEFGPELSTLRDRVIQIDSASPNAGDYLTADSVSGDLTAMQIQRSLAVFNSPGGRPTTFTARLGGYKVVFTSASTLTDSRLQVSGSGYVNLWGVAGPTDVVGSTAFIRLPSLPTALQVDDLVEVYSSTYNTPSFIGLVSGIESSNSLVEVFPEVALDTSFNFSQTSQVPFARIRSGHKDTYDALKSELDAWLLEDANSDVFFTNLQRLINTLLVNDNPTISAVNTANLEVQKLIIALTDLDTILSGYNTSVVPQVDTLIHTFLEKGADRAVDTLLSAQFSVFFGYNNDEVSYLGNAQARLRDVEREDLPVRRTGRQEQLDQELLISELEEPDAEFDQSDVQNIEDVNIPGQFIDIEGGNF